MPIIKGFLARPKRFELLTPRFVVCRLLLSFAFQSTKYCDEMSRRAQFN
jgi:hypothetical protein